MAWQMRRMAFFDAGISCHKARRIGNRAIPSLWHATSSAASEPSPEVSGSCQSPGSRSFDVALEPRPLSSTGITRLLRYYGPLRHPQRPGLSLTGCRLVSPHHRRGLPVLRRIFLYACCRQYPGGTVGCARCSLPQRRRPSPAEYRVGSRIAVFEACSAFHSRFSLHTRGVALRPFTPEASEVSLPTSLLRLLPTGATLVGWDSHPLKIRAFPRRTFSRQQSAPFHPTTKSVSNGLPGSQWLTVLRAGSWTENPRGRDALALRISIRQAARFLTYG